MSHSPREGVGSDQVDRAPAAPLKEGSGLDRLIDGFRSAHAAKESIVFGFEEVKFEQIQALLRIAERLKRVFFVIFCAAGVNPPKMPPKNVFFISISAKSINGDTYKTQFDQLFAAIRQAHGDECKDKCRCRGKYAYKRYTYMQGNHLITARVLSGSKAKKLAKAYDVVSVVWYPGPSDVHVYAREKDVLKSALERLKAQYWPGETLLVDFGNICCGLAWEKVAHFDFEALPDVVQVYGIATNFWGLEDTGDMDAAPGPSEAGENKTMASSVQSQRPAISDRYGIFSRFSAGPGVRRLFTGKK